MQRYDPSTSIYKFDGNRMDLAGEFRDHPKGPHSEELRRVLNRMRTTPMTGRYVVLIDVPFRRWTLARLSGARGAPPQVFSAVHYNSLADAEWDIFKRRWQDLTGIAVTA